MRGGSLSGQRMPGGRDPCLVMVIVQGFMEEAASAAKNFPTERELQVQFCDFIEKANERTSRTAAATCSLQTGWPHCLRPWGSACRPRGLGSHAGQETEGRVVRGLVCGRQFAGQQSR